MRQSYKVARTVRALGAPPLLPLGEGAGVRAVSSYPETLGTLTPSLPKGRGGVGSLMRILGIDPGSRLTGFGIVNVSRNGRLRMSPAASCALPRVIWPRG